MSYCCHTAVILLSYCCHTTSYCCHPAVIFLSYCCHTVVILLSYCCHTAVILLSYCCHTVVIVMSYCYHTSAVIMLSYCCQTYVILISDLLIAYAVTCLYEPGCMYRLMCVKLNICIVKCSARLYFIPINMIRNTLKTYIVFNNTIRTATHAFLTHLLQINIPHKICINSNITSNFIIF